MLVMTSAGAIAPIALGPEVFSRDFAVMALLTLTDGSHDRLGSVARCQERFAGTTIKICGNYLLGSLRLLLCPAVAIYLEFSPIMIESRDGIKRRN